MGENKEGPGATAPTEGLTIELPRVQIDPKSADTIGRRISPEPELHVVEPSSVPDNDIQMKEAQNKGQATSDVKGLPDAPKNGKSSGNGNRRAEEEAELGIYEDTAECDDLSDYEAEIKRKKNSEEGGGGEGDKARMDVRETKAGEVKAPDGRKDSMDGDGSRITFDKTVDKQPEEVRKSSQSFSIKDLQRMSGYTRGKTPMSTLTDLSDPRTHHSKLMRARFVWNASRLALESREAMFRRAMTLLSARCTSVHRGSESGQDVSKDQPYGQYLYINQERPVPMPPLKAWRGYNGNVYFEPINILPVKGSRGSEDGVQSVRSAPSRSQATKKRTLSEQQAADSRSNSQQTNKSSQGSVRPGTRQMVLMDKQAVLSRFNENLHEDVVWLEGQENTGSLAIKPRQGRERTQTALLYKKLCKGSMAHKLHVENQARRQPALKVSGGKFVPPASMSPLLRAQTQYSLSSHRLTTNSPDPFHLTQESKLPPLEQIRASLKHEPAVQRPKTYNRPVTITDELKPFVKYSPDVVAKFNQQANIC